MSRPPRVLTTTRLRLRRWEAADREPFALLHADPEVMRDYGGPIERAASDAKLDRYRAAFEQHGYSRWAVESLGGRLLGYVGVMPVKPGHPLGPHADIGWRLAREAWGQGFATEAARAALEDVFTRMRLDEVLAYAAPDNARSHAVMDRLGMRRDPARDFTVAAEPFDAWRGLVWVATAASGRCPT